MAIPSFSSTVVARAAAALYGLQLGNGTMSAVLAEANAGSGVDALINSVYNRDHAGKSNADVAKVVVANLGITGAGVANAEAYLTAVLDATPAAEEGAAVAAAVAAFSEMTADATYGAAARLFNDRIATAVAYSQQGGTSDRAFGAGATIATTLGQDFLTGTSGNDTITARIFAGSNTLQSGDWIDGGAGTDKIDADLGTGEGFAITPESKNVEWFSVRGQSRALDSGDNNTANEGLVIVDAQRLDGVTRYDSNESRADVIIEDVRTPLRTKDITIGMIGTDQGNVDYAVYFDRLRSESASVAQLSIELMDTRAASAGLDPLKDSPYNGFSFFVNGTKYTLKDETPQSTDTATFNGAQTYEHLLAAIRTLLEKAGLGGTITADFGPDFQAIDTKSGISSTGRTIMLSGSAAGGVTLAVGNFIADDGVPADSGLHTVQSTAVVSSTDLITSSVILDDVGRGSNGGDLVIGAKSVGETSSSAGIARFEIKVENSSALGIIASTNNALKEVIATNGDVKGTLKVQGFDNTASIVPGAARDAGTNNNLPGATAQHNAYGFNDVRKIDMSAMVGAVTYDAQITAASFAKYIQLSDTDQNPKTDNDSTDGKTTRQVADFDYTGGTAGDTMAVVIDENVIASDSKVQVGREDFTFLMDGKAGDDNITVVVGRVDRDTDGANPVVYGTQSGAELLAGTTVTVANDGEGDDDAYLPGGLANWYQHQNRLKNITINGGEGNDTIRKPGSGDVTYNLGSGNDTLYTDNTGTLNTLNSVVTNSGRAMWVFNTNDQLNAGAPERNVDDLISTGNQNWYIYRASLTVTFLGTSALGDLAGAGNADALESAAVPIGFSATTYKSSDLHINQAIKAAINNDPVLSKLLVAEDGPGYSLVVRSLIDGVRADNNISINIELPTSNQLTNTEVSKVAAAWEQDFAFGSPQQQALRALITTPSASGLLAFEDGTGVGALGALDNGIVEFESGAGDGAGYVAALGNDGAADLTGADSTATTTDNSISGDAGNDVIVLSTTVGATALESSNDRIKFGADFGHDTIVNFELAGTGVDTLDVIAIGGFGSSGVTSNPIADVSAAIGDPVDGEIYIQQYTSAGMAALTTATIASRYSGNATMTADYYGVLGASETFVYVAVDAHNVGHVYKVVDTLTTTAVVTKMGEIDLAEVLWTDLTAANFNG